MPSSIGVRAEDLARGVPLLSLVVDEESLRGAEEGIIRHFQKRGRAWERLVYVSYFEDGELQFGTSAGLRLHGGKHRKTGKSFRVYFRNEYGAEHFEPRRIFRDRERPIRTLVVRAPAPFSMKFVEPITSEISRKIGAVAPEIKPALLYFNGRVSGYYLLSEHLGRRQWKTYFGHEDFDFYRYKGSSDAKSEQSYRELEEWVKGLAAPLSMREVGAAVDLENLSKHLLSIIFCATDDWRQGVAARDRRQKSPKWFWINWDMDHSFKDFTRRRKGRKPWEQEVIGLIAGPTHRADGVQVSTPGGIEDVRSLIFSRLLRESAEYRRFFARLVMDTLNHPLKRSYLLEVAGHYLDLDSTSSRKSRMLMRLPAFLEHRPAYIREQIREHLGAGAAHEVQIAIPSGVEITIDGFAERGVYRGMYFDGSTVTAEMPSEYSGKFSHWLVNGNRTDGNRLEYNVTKGTHIDVVLGSTVRKGTGPSRTGVSPRKT